MTAAEAPQASTDTRIHDAATLILWRETPAGPAVLMGQRAAGAVFMPSKFVFPGGRLDASDTRVPVDPDAAAVAIFGPATPALAAAAIRETWEETGLLVARPGSFAGMPGWEAFSDAGLQPDARPLRAIFRAITPPGRPRRFDARFFLAPATALAGDPDDLSRAGAELAHLRWLPLDAARGLDLPFITEIVLAEVASCLADPGAVRPVPFFDNSGDRPRFRALGVAP